MPRPRIYATDAERIAAYRERKTKLDLVVDKDRAEKIKEIAKTLGVSKNTLLNAMVRFALTNHNWKKQGIVWGPK
jgi:hypothetical protein